MIALPPEERCFSRYPDRLTCVLRRGHVGLHANGSSRWADDEALPHLAASLPLPPSMFTPPVTAEYWLLIDGGQAATGPAGHYLYHFQEPERPHRLPSYHRYVAGRGIVCGGCTGTSGLMGPSPRWWTCDTCQLHAPIVDIELIPGMSAGAEG